MSALDAFPHAVRPGGQGYGGPALLTLHGTGGDEHDLLDLAAAVAPGAPVLSPRGPVREGDANRWFRRFAEGRFDLDDARRRAAALAAWLPRARAAHGMAERPLVALGYSNGANIAGALLLHGASGLAGAALLRAQHVLDGPGDVDLAGLPVLVLSGERDQLVPASESARLATALRAAGAAVQHVVTAGAGHGLTSADVTACHAFLATTGAHRCN